MKAEITNTSKANQGVYTPEGLQFIEPGKTRTLVIRDDYVERVKSLPFLSIKGEETAAQAPEGDGLDGMKVADLKKVADDEGVDISEAKKKDDIVAAIRAERAVPTDDPRTDDELRAAVIDRFGEEGAADLDRQTMIDLLADEPA